MDAPRRARRAPNRIACYWCPEVVEVGPDVDIVVCAKCTAGGAKLPDKQLLKGTWKPVLTNQQAAAKGMIFD